jgi:HEAT repeat protein
VSRTCLAIFGLVMLLAATASVARWSPVPQTQPSLGDLLQEHHIELTEAALLQALENADSDVRFLAAVKLNDDKAADAIPKIKEALAAEIVPRARVNIALALGLLGDPTGRNEIKHLCADKNFPSEFRLYAVRYMFDLHVENDDDCLHAAEKTTQIVDSDYRSTGYRIIALSLLPRFRGLTPEEAKNVLQLVVARLDDPEPTVRMQAGQSLIALGDPEISLPYLEGAIPKEKDDVVRSTLEKDLEKLRQRLRK